MAEFEPAYKHTMSDEGGYNDDPDDPGAETYKGISRHWHPTWEGWKIIDSYRIKPGFPNRLNSLDMLQELVFVFYREEFWSRMKGEVIEDQKVANEIFDTSVNLDVPDAIKFAQTTLNALNYDHGGGLLYPDLEVDGRIGPATLDALNYISDTKEEALLLGMNSLQVVHYMGQKRMRKFMVGLLLNRGR